MFNPQRWFILLMGLLFGRTRDEESVYVDEQGRSTQRNRYYS